MRPPLPLRLLCGTAVLVGVCGLRAEASEPIPNRTGDGVVLINQNRAVNGGVTPGDAPGFPITISRPGSYRLASNLNASGLVIEIVADGVSLDLNGFSIIGPGIFGPSSQLAIAGAGRARARVHNGAISGYTQALDFTGASEFIIIENLRIYGTTTSSSGPVGGVAMMVGREKAARAIIRDVITDGQIQLTCPSLVLNTVADSVVETDIPDASSGVPFPAVCKGENVVQATYP